MDYCQDGTLELAESLFEAVTRGDIQVVDKQVFCCAPYPRNNRLENPGQMCDFVIFPLPFCSIIFFIYATVIAVID
jgi:hypothetical protein